MLLLFCLGISSLDTEGASAVPDPYPPRFKSSRRKRFFFFCIPVLLKVPELAECGGGVVLQGKQGSCYQRKGNRSWGGRKNSFAHSCQRDLCLTEELPSEGGPSGQCFHFLPFDPLSFIPFLQGLDWAALAARKIPAPFRPQIRSELDVGNFAEEFTRLDVYIDASIRSPMCQNSVGSAILPADQAPHMWWGPRFPGLQGCVTRGQEVGLPSLSRSHRGIWEPQPTQYFSH